MASVLKVDKLDPQSGTALELGTSGDTISVPSGATLDISASTLTPPATMPASSAANLTNIPGANITGTIAAVSGANLTSLNATNLGSGTVPTARLGTGSASSSTFLRGDGTWDAAGGGKVLQVVRGVLSSSTYVTGTTATEIMNTSITPAANANYIYAVLSTNYQMSCNDNTSNPYGNIRIKVGSTSGTTKADAGLRDINSSGATNVDRSFIGSLSAYWTEDTTSSVAVYVTVENGTTNGRIGCFGTDTSTNATTLTLMEIEG